MRTVDNANGLIVRLEIGKLSVSVECELEKNNSSLNSAADYQLLYATLFEKPFEIEALVFSETLWQIAYLEFRGRLAAILSRTEGERFSKATALILNDLFSLQVFTLVQTPVAAVPTSPAASPIDPIQMWRLAVQSPGFFNSPKCPNYFDQTFDEAQCKLLEEAETLRSTSP